MTNETFWAIRRRELATRRRSDRPAPPPPEPEEKPLSRMTKAELEAIAEAEGVDLSEATNNPSRVAAIEAARADGAEG